MSSIQYGPFERFALKKAGPGVRGLLVRLGHQIDGDLLNSFPDLKVLASATTGTNHIDLDVCRKKGIEVVTLQGETEFLDQISSTAEHAFGLILALAKNTSSAFNAVKLNGFGRGNQVGLDLSGKTLGIIGFGRLGRKVSAFAKTFGMKVIACDIKNLNDDGISQVGMDELLNKADVVSLHASHTNGELPLLDATAFNKMKNGALLVNTARGELINEKDLLDALTSEKISAALDVVNNETERSDPDPLIVYARQYDNLILTPHIGGATIDSMEKAELFIVNKMISKL